MGAETISIDVILRAALRDEVRQAVAEVLGDMKTKEPLPSLLTSEQLAAELGVSTVHIRKLTAQGMPHVRFGDARRYSLIDVIEWARTKEWDEVLP